MTNADLQEPAKLLQPSAIVVLSAPLIEDADAVAVDRPQGSREIGIPVPLTGGGSALTVDQLYGPRSVVPPEFLYLIRPVLRDDRRDWEPFLGEAKAGCQRLDRASRVSRRQIDRLPTRRVMSRTNVGELPEAITGPAAWIGRDMRDRSGEWLIRLSDADIADLE